MRLRRGTKDWNRFWSKVKKGPGCWLWSAGTDRDSYGLFRLNNKQKRSHRLVYEMGNRAIPHNMNVCHSCDTPSCVRPSHLFLGTHLDNKHDAMLKGRDAHGESHFNSKLTTEQILAIRKDTRSLRKIAVDYNVDYTNVYKIKRRKSWKHIK